jgi:hypothetical protein
MRIAAICDRCGREFLLFQLYTASSFAADRCPHCSAHLGIVRVAPLAASADEALAALVRSLREIAGRNPGFRLDPQTVLGPVTEALDALARRDHEAQVRSGQAA